MKTFFLLVAFLISGSILLVAQNAITRVEAGKTIFLSNCASCHSLTRAPFEGMQPLQHIRELRGKEYVYNFVWNAAKLLYQKNKTALKVYNDAQRMAMNVFPFLTKNDIDAICDYIDTQPIIKKK